MFRYIIYLYHIYIYISYIIYLYVYNCVHMYVYIYTYIHREWQQTWFNMSIERFNPNRNLVALRSCNNCLEPKRPVVRLKVCWHPSGKPFSGHFWEVTVTRCHPILVSCHRSGTHDWGSWNLQTMAKNRLVPVFPQLKREAYHSTRSWQDEKHKHTVHWPCLCFALGRQNPKPGAGRASTRGSGNRHRCLVSKTFIHLYNIHIVQYILSFSWHTIT